MTIFLEDPLDMLNALMIFKDDKWQIDTVGDDFDSQRGSFSRLEDALNALVESGVTGSLAAPFDGILQVLFESSESLAITTQPQDVDSDGEGNATLSIEATGENLTYEWYEEIDPDVIVDNEDGYAEDATNIAMDGATSADVGDVVRSESDELMLATSVERTFLNFDAERGYRGTSPAALDSGESIPFFRKIEGEGGAQVEVSVSEDTRYFAVVGDGESYVVSDIVTVIDASDPPGGEV